MSEKAELSSQLSETAKKLDCEVRARENRDIAVIQESQDTLAAKEKARFT
jgi:hypothetical protein